ncbi:hypothetical protein [Paenibacillus validus]|uniref:Uncharacterized protein n=1 Tax=Paenibacillus validus TaxID=44253 RepID=A0A7X2ZEC5_9BACL|nr:hypothetical protein [Paenibacillus validus]MUG73326.1 hypothetical protein [Paenibacillus validus]
MSQTTNRRMMYKHYAQGVISELQRLAILINKNLNEHQNANISRKILIKFLSDIFVIRIERISVDMSEPNKGQVTIGKL